jgi:putative transposase
LLVLSNGNHAPIWNWIKYTVRKKITSKKKKMEEFIIDETAIKKVGSVAIWLWVATIEPDNKEIVARSITKEQNKFVAERFVSSLIKTH